MAIMKKYGTDHIDWVVLCEIFRLARLGTREPEKLKRASEKSHTVCSVFSHKKMIGFGRAISDGQYQSAIYDVVVLPDYQNQGVGKMIMVSLLVQLPESGSVLMFVAPGRQGFYRKFGFGNLKTGMGLFPNPKLLRENGYLE